jgi:[ribosomal protein S5]-alanine N-acetyltransferase
VNLESPLPEAPVEPPTLHTERLILRPFEMEDAARVQELAGDPKVADTTLHIPHPYPDGAAEKWIASHRQLFRFGEQVTLAITLKDGGDLIGAVGLVVSAEHRRAEIGYWVGVEHWGRGYCTEAARAMIDHAFDQLELNRVFAHHFTRNPASGRVMVKAGLRPEGNLRQHIVKWGVSEDLAVYGLLRSEWAAARGDLRQAERGEGSPISGWSSAT